MESIFSTVTVPKLNFSLFIKISISRCMFNTQNSKNYVNFNFFRVPWSDVIKKKQYSVVRKITGNTVLSSLNHNLHELNKSMLIIFTSWYSITLKIIRYTTLLKLPIDPLLYDNTTLKRARLNSLSGHQTWINTTQNEIPISCRWNNDTNLSSSRVAIIKLYQNILRYGPVTWTFRLIPISAINRKSTSSQSNFQRFYSINEGDYFLIAFLWNKT